MNTFSPKDQFLVLASISNYHKHGYPSVRVPSTIIQPTHINFVEHGLYDPFARKNFKGNSIRKYIPQSPRNHIMYFLSTSQETENFHLTKHCLQKDSASSMNPAIDISDEYVSWPKKKRKQTFCTVSVTQCAVFDEVGGYLNEELNCESQNQMLYNIFEEQLVCEGTLRWRQHN